MQSIQNQSPSQAQQHQSLLADYDNMLSRLKNTDTPSIYIEQSYLAPTPHSPMAQDHDVAQLALQELLEDEDYQALCRQLKTSFPGELTVTMKEGRGVYETSILNGTETITLSLADKPKWRDLTARIDKATQKLSGQIRSDQLVSIPRMAMYYGLTPWNLENTAEHCAAVHSLEEKRASYSLQLDSGVDIDAVNRAPTKKDRKILNNVQRVNPNYPITMESLIAQLTKRDMTDIVRRFLPETETSLFSYLEKNTLPRANAEQVRATPMVFLEKILRSAESERLGNALLKGLNWYGGKPGEDASPGVRIKLVSKAIRLWTNESRSNKPDDIAGYPWYQRSNWGKSYQNILAEFKQHLFDSKRASSTTEATLLAQLFQPEFPRDFQIPDIPPDLPYRSSAVWVNFVHGVTLAESMEPDLIQRMTFQQLVDFPLQQSMQATPKEQELIGLSRIPPTLEWAITNDIILERTDSDYSQEEIDRSIKALDEHTDALRKAIIQLDVNYPERSAIAEREMKTYFKDALFINHEGKPAKPFGPSSLSTFISDGRKLIEDFGDIDGGGLIQTPALKDKIYSFRDVYMSGKLTKNKTWFITMKDGIRKSTHRISINADRTIKTTAPWLPESLTQKPLPDAEELFESEFDNYLERSKSAYQTLLKCQLSSLPYDDRQAIEQGAVKIYTLRKSTSGIKREDETPANTLPLRLRMGFILQIAYNAKTTYYECLPRAGIIRRRADISSDMLNGVEHGEATPGFFEPDDMIMVRRGKRVPFDWDAHENGSLPKENATCEAIIDQFGETFTAPSLSPDSEQSSRPTVAFSRASELANLIANNFFYFDEKLLRATARGVTEIERIAASPHWLDSVKGFIPFWGSISDLLSGDPKRKTWGIFGLIVDVASFAFPLGKFVSGSLKLVSTAIRSGVRTALPKFGAISQKLLISSVQNAIPFYGVPTLALRLSRGLLRGLYAGVKFVVKKSFNSLKFSLGRAGKYSFIDGFPQVTDPGRWTPLTTGDRLATLRGLEDVPVRNIGSTIKPVHYLIDPVSAKPYGPVLKVSENELSIGPSLYPTVGKNSDSLLFKIPENTRVGEVLEVDGRTTLFLDDVPYRLDDNTLRRVGMIDDSDALKLIPCRPRRAPGETTCPVSYVNGEPFATPAVGSFDETKGYAPWFGDRISTPGARPDHDQSLLAIDGAVYHGSGDTLKKFDGDLTTLGFTKKWLVPSKNIPANLEFQKGIYARIMVKGTYEGAHDSHKVGAIVGRSFDESTIYVFTRLNTDKYYVATLSKGQSLSEPLTLNLLLKDDLAKGTVGEELLRVYTGSLSANNIARIHGVEALEHAMKTMDEIAIPIGTGATPADNMKWLKVDTSPGEALMFDHSTRMIVSKLPEGATSWARSKEAPEAFRQRTVEIFDELFLEPTIKLNNVDSALRIDTTMQKLHNLIPPRQRSRTLRNIAYAEVTTASGNREVYVSVSGAQGATGHLPLFKQHLGADQIKVGETTYFNIDLNRTFPSTSLNVTEEGKLLTVPPTIKDIGTYHPALTRTPKSLDSETKLISVIREKYPDPQAIKSVNVATTMPPCESCSVVIKEFGYDGGANALNVLWH